jgi:hypothetical protein
MLHPFQALKGQYTTKRNSVQVLLSVRGCIQKFSDWVDNEIYAYNHQLSLRCNIKGYEGKTH